MCGMRNVNYSSGIFEIYLLFFFYYISYCFDYLEDRLTVVVVVVHTPHSILKNDRTRTVIRTFKCTVPMRPNPKKFKKNFFGKFFLIFVWLVII